MKSRNQEWQKEQFNTKGNSVAAWCLNAYPLLAGARVLNRNNTIEAHVNNDVLPDEACTLIPTFLLYGFALESLIKACLLKTGEKLIVNGNFTKIKGANMHDLVALAKLAKLILSQEESDVLKKLSVQIVSFARYPTGKKFSNEGPIKISGERLVSPNLFNSGDIGVIEGIVSKIGGIIGLDFSNSSFKPIEI